MVPSGRLLAALLVVVVGACTPSGALLPGSVARPTIQALPTATQGTVAPSPAEPTRPSTVEPTAVILPTVPAEPTDAPPAEPAATPDPTNPATPAPTCAPAPADLAPVPVLSHGPRARKLVALTFDDGWDAANTARIVATLRTQRVNATFFPTGWSLAHLPGTWTGVAAAGFPIGNRTDDHLSLAGRCYATQLAQLAAFSAEARSLGIVPFGSMRPPSASYDVTTRITARAAGQAALVLWDVDTRDWAGADAGTVTARALAGQEGSIVLMHTFPAATATALPSIIDGYRARGFTFATVGQLLGLGGPVPIPGE